MSTFEISEDDDGRRYWLIEHVPEGYGSSYPIEHGPFDSREDAEEAQAQEEDRA